MTAPVRALGAPHWLRRFLERASACSKVVAVLLVTAVSLRFAIASVQHALSVSRSNFAETPVRHVDSAPAPASARPSKPATAAAPPAPSVPAGQPRRVTLGVSAGPPRSDVYVNGRLVGQTPFLGDTSCKTGQEIRVEVVPPKGPPLTYVRDCRGGALEISGPPP